MLNAILVTCALALQGQTPVPEAAAQKEAEKIIRDIFKEDYAKKTPADRAALAGKMVTQAADVRGDPATAYVLYVEAQDLYSQAGDVGKALETVDALAKTFAVDGLALKSTAITTAGKSSKTPDDALKLAGAHLRLASDALQADQYDLADKSVQGAMGLAKRANNPGLAARAAAKAKEASELKSKYEKVRKAKEVLASNSEEPAANFAVGQFQAVVKGAWDAGLPLLAKGSDAAYQAAAGRELAGPKEAPEQSAVGDLWWDLADKETGTGRDNLRAHAASWYEKALPSLAGLLKTKAERRIQDVLLEKLNRGTWVDVSDGKLFGKAAGTLELPLHARAPLQKMPPGPFDGLQIRVKAKGEGLFSVQYEPEKLDMELNVSTGHFSTHHLVGNTWMRDLDVPCPTKDEYLLTVLLVDAECVFYLDGRETFRRAAVNDHILGLQFFCWSGKVQIDQIKLRKKE